MELQNPEQNREIQFQIGYLRFKIVLIYAKAFFTKYMTLTGKGRSGIPKWLPIVYHGCALHVSFDF